MSVTFTQLTQAQSDTLRAMIAADTTANAMGQAGDDAGLSAWLNTPDAAYIVWRTNMTIAECNQVMVWTEIDGLTVGKARIWEWMRSMGTLDASQTNIRQGFSDAFTTATATKAAITALAKRQATRAEKKLATGTGTTATPAILVFEGQIDPGQASSLR